MNGNEAIPFLSIFEWTVVHLNGGKIFIRGYSSDI